MPSVSELAFYHPACSATPLDAEVLADLEATSQDIAYTISEGRQVPNGWGVVHLGRHLDFLVGFPCAIGALSQKLGRNKARQWGEVAPFGMVQAWAGQKLLKRDILRVFPMSLFYNISGDYR